MRKLKVKIDSLTVSDRSVRRYIQALKDEISFRQPRYYESVIDMMPGVQCQVDGGELRGVMIGGKETTVYFMVFVLSYSRLMHVSVSAGIAIFFWQPIASIVITVPARSYRESNLGMAVISFDLSSTLPWPKTRLFYCAQALNL